MAKRRRSNPLALAVLVLLSERPMYPYEIAATLRQRRQQDSIKIRYGSLYTVIDSLQKQGLIRERESFREGRRPERTVYELTPAGKVEMSDWLRELIARPVKEYTHFEAGLCLLAALPPNEAIPLLKEREQSLERESRQLRVDLKFVLGMGLPRLYLVEVDYRLSRIESEREFVGSLLRRIEEEQWDTSPTWWYLHRDRDRESGNPEPQAETKGQKQARKKST
jgi:DNA-binding PadR family transcriptional regulator